MKSSRYNFDPWADVEQLLVNPNVQQLITPRAPKVVDDLVIRPGTNFQCLQKSSRSEPSRTWSQTGLGHAAPSARAAGTTDIYPKSHDIRMMVSSKHLMLASMYFQNM
jgi:transcription initiation factor TFIID subunit TAF12